MSTTSLAPQNLARLLLSLMLVMAGAFATTAVTATPAQALCAAQPMVGNWTNIDSATRSLTRVNVGFNCGDVRLCDENGNCSGGESYFTLRPFGKCSPTDCDWGTRRASTMADGWQRAVWTHSWATKSVWVKTYTYYGRQYLRVWSYTDFTAADGRTDYSTDEWMLK